MSLFLVTSTLFALAAGASTSAPAGNGAMPTGTMPSGMMPSGAMPSGAAPTGGSTNQAMNGMMGPPLTPQELAQSRSGEVYWSVAMNMVLSSLFFGFRLISRYMTRITPRLSDWTLLVGILFNFVLGGCYIWSAKAGAGRHFQAILMEDPGLALGGIPFKAMFIGSTIYFAAIAAIKCSILVLYYEIFGTNERFRLAVWFMLFMVLGWWISFTVLNFNLCTPLSDVWNPGPDNKHQCVMGPHYLANGIINVLEDALIICLPTRMVWTIQLPARTKLALSFVFLLGGIVCLASSFRLAYTMLDTDSDPTYGVPTIEVWSMIELLVAIVAACLLTMGPLFKLIVPSFITTAITRRSRSRSRTGARSHSTKLKHGSHMPLGGTTSADDSTATGHGDPALSPDDVALKGLYHGGGPRGSHVVSTRISSRPGQPDAAAGRDAADEKALRGIHVVQEGPVFRVEPRRGSDGDDSSTDVEAGHTDARSLNNASTKELFPSR